MQSKRTFIVALVGVNLLLLGALIFSTSSPPAAYGQAVGRAGDFVMTTCQAHTDFDSLFIIDQPARLLHCFAPVQDRSGKLRYIGWQNLANDFKVRRP